MQSDQGKTRTETRKVGCDSNVATQCKTQTCSGTRTIHRRDHRFRERSHRTRDVLALGEYTAESTFVFVVPQLFQILDVASCRKSAAFAGHDDDTDPIVFRNFFQRIENFLAHRTAERIQFFGPIELYCGNGAGYRKNDRLIHESAQQPGAWLTFISLSCLFWIFTARSSTASTAFRA